MKAARRPGAHVAVIIPAHNEAETLATCLSSVRDSIRYAARRGALETAQIVVVAHACCDESIAEARSIIGREQPGAVLVFDHEADVGRVRDLGARVGLALLGASDPASTWLLSTDADTVVPDTWITSCLGEAAAARAHCVVGLAHLDAWRGSLEAEASYAALIDSKIAADTHDHVYGANLAIRADAYLAVGGFPVQGHGEDRRLVDALQVSGYSVLKSLSVEVTTSGRTIGRARDGLADLLRELDEASESVDFKPSSAS